MNFDELLESIDDFGQTDMIDDLLNDRMFESGGLDLEDDIDTLFESTLGVDRYLEDDGFDSLFESADDFLGEKTIIKLDKKAALKKSVSNEAMQIAKKENPALFAKYKKTLTLKKKYEQLILKKYGAKAKVSVKKKMSAK